MKESSWDLDYRDGKKGEDTVAHLLAVETVEVKTDRRWKETGNVYIETQCFYQNSQSWEPSGINVTKASHWAFVLDDLVVVIPTERLRKIVLSYGRPIDCKIEPNPSKGMLVSVTHLLAVV